jgi:4-carboxymuconolactone decarboxylase
MQQEQLSDADSLWLTTLSSPVQILAAVVIAAALNEPVLLRRTLVYALEHRVSPCECYEALLQTYLFAGFPAAVEGLSALSAVLKEQGKEYVQQAQPYDLEQFRERGEQLCARIYTSTYGKMRTKMAVVSPDLDAWMIIEGYGKTLSREGLSVQTRELLIVAVLAALGWQNQLHSHIRGAFNVGVSGDECRTVLALLTKVHPTPVMHERQQRAYQLVETLLTP